MMKTGDVWSKILDFFGFEAERSNSYDDMETMDNYETKRDKNRVEKSNKRVVSIYKNKDFRIMVYKPDSFSVVRQIVDEFRMGKPVILNLKKLDKAEGRRIVDFISGAVYALEGNIERISEVVFVFSPQNVKIKGEEIKKNKSLFS